MRDLNLRTYDLNRDDVARLIRDGRVLLLIHAAASLRYLTWAARERIAPAPGLYPEVRRAARVLAPLAIAQVLGFMLLLALPTLAIGYGFRASLIGLASLAWFAWLLTSEERAGDVWGIVAWPWQTAAVFGVATIGYLVLRREIDAFFWWLLCGTLAGVLWIARVSYAGRVVRGFAVRSVEARTELERLGVVSVTYEPPN